MLPAVATDIKASVDNALARLVSARVDGDRARVAIPVLYPSGAGSAVEVVLNKNDCFVSDIALGFSEAEMYGASEFYSPCARKAVERFGVSFDGLSVFAIRASIDRLEGAIASVANASVNAATAAIFRAIDEKEKKKNTELFDKIRRIFGSNNVSKTQEIMGRDAAWEAHNVVRVADNKAIFEYVNDNPTSISSKFIMFSDLSHLASETISLNTVVISLDSIGRKGKLLADVSNVIPFSLSDLEYRRYARAP